MTGATLARRLLEEQGIECSVLHGTASVYIPWERRIELERDIYYGKTATEMTIAAHEVGHAMQHARIGWLVPAMRWTVPGRLWLEWDASKRARAMLKGRVKIDEAALRDSWQSYVRPAVRDGVIASVLIGVWIFKAL